jgi:hypothetical protein
MSAINASNECDPLTGPIERIRILDRHEPEIPFRKPLLKEALRIANVVRWHRDRPADHLAQTVA